MSDPAPTDTAADPWHSRLGRDEEPHTLAWANALGLSRELGLNCVELSADSAVFQMERSPLQANPNGAVNGGLVAAVADQAMGVITLRAAPDGALPATAALHIQFHAPALPPLTFRASVLRGGRRLKFVEVAVYDRTGQRCATSQGTMVSGGSGRTSLPE